MPVTISPMRSRVLLEDDALLGFADALVDDLLGRLRRDPTEVLRGDLHAFGHGRVDLGLLVLDRRLVARREDELEHVYLAGIPVDLHL